MASFTHCIATARPNNTLFPDVDSYHVSFNHMKTYLPLILALFELSPECAFGLVGNPFKFLWSVHVWVQIHRPAVVLQLRGNHAWQLANCICENRWRGWGQPIQVSFQEGQKGLGKHGLLVTIKFFISIFAVCLHKPTTFYNHPKLKFGTLHVASRKCAT